MATMNLRTKAFGSKTMREVKAAETLPPFENEAAKCQFCHVQVQELIDKVKTEDIFELQIQHLRSLVTKLSTDNGHEVCHNRDALVFWFFNLPQGSSLRQILASSLNKLDKSDELFVSTFDKAILNMIENDNDNLATNISRCFENCHPALAAVKRNVQALFKVLEAKDLTKVSRLLLSLETIGKSSDLKLVERITKECFQDDQIPGEIKSNLSLIWAHELRHHQYKDEPENFSQFVAESYSKPEEITELSKQLPLLSSIWSCHIAQAILILGGQELLKGNALEALLDVINQHGETDSTTAYIKSLAVLQCINRHLALVKQSHDYQESGGSILKKYQVYTLTNLNYGIDRVRYNVKNVFEKLVELLQMIGNDAEFRELVNAVLALPWESKSKSVALASLAKANLNVLIQIEPNLPEKVVQLTQDPTIESVAVDLYENLMKCAFKSHPESWMRSWIRPIFQVIQDESISTMRLLKTSLMINRTAVIETLTKEHKNKTNLSLIGLKLDRLSGGQAWKQHYQDVIVPATRHFQDSTRILALDLIISSHSSREEFNIDELALIRKTLELNMVLQVSAERKQMITVMKKLIRRLKAAMTSSTRVKNAMDYTTFIQDLFHYFVNSLFEDASFSRRSIALELLYDLVTHVNDVVEPLKTKEVVEILLKSFHDSFEQNKNLSLEILKTFPDEVTLIHDKKYVEAMLEKLLEMTKSVKPADSASAEFLAKYLSLSNSIPNICSILIKELASHILLAEQSLGKAACQRPIYGALVSIRAVITDNPGTDVIRQLMTKCLKIVELISPILNSDSPEGQKLTSMEDEAVSPQLLLLCAWRTSKEISLLFGQLCIYLQNEEALLMQMSQFFVNQLANIKHRGAFEQAFIGFCSICSFMWKTPKYNQVPKQLLGDTLDELTGENLKFCATRRSAGVPFLIQAVVSTEPKEANHASLKVALSKLIGLCQDNRAEIRIHAYNILRVLYRDSTLGEVVSPYVSDGLKAAILGFQSNSWPERNSSTLLFSSLCTRIFGVKRSKNELSKRNSMSARMFFQRFPDMYPFLLAQVTSVAKIIQKTPDAVTPQESALYPILIILAKLHPVITFQEEDEKFQLLDFVDPLAICCGSAILKIRELAAQAYISVIYRNNHSSRDFLVQWLSADEQLTHNQFHGKLLQLRYLFRLMTSDETSKKELENVLLREENGWLKVQLDKVLLHFLRTNRCGVVRASILEVLLALTRSFGLNFDGFDNDDAITNKEANAASAIWKPHEAKLQSQLRFHLGLTSDVAALHSSKNSDERLAFFENADADKLNYQDLAPLVLVETHPQCLEALLSLTLLLLDKETTLRDVLPFERQVIDLAFNSGATCEFMNDRLRGLFIELSAVVLSRHKDSLESVISQWIKSLLDVLQTTSNSSEIKRSLCLAIGHVYDKQPGLHSALLWLLTDDDFEIRGLAAHVLGSNLAPLLAFEEHLSQLLESGDSSVAHNLLGKLDESSSLDAEELSYESEESAFDKSEINGWREESILRKLIRDLINGAVAAEKH